MGEDDNRRVDYNPHTVCLSEGGTTEESNLYFDLHLGVEIPRSLG